MGGSTVRRDQGDDPIATRERRPVGIAAAVLAVAIVGALGWGAQILAARRASREALAAAATPAAIKSRTLTLQRAALADGRLLPVYGSSELYCCGDPYRATQLFASYPTGFEAFGIGRPGIGNLLFMETFGALSHALTGKKVVIIDSPPWFSESPDQHAYAYAENFSPEIAGLFIFASPISLPLREAAARRMLAHPRTLEEDTVLRLAVQALARPTPLRLAGYSALVPLGRLEAWVDESWDGVWTLAFLARHDWSRTTVGPQRTKLDWNVLATRATRIAERRDTTNPFGFPDEVFRRMMHRRHKDRLENALAAFRSGVSNRDGQLFPAPTAWQQRVASSAQWTDLQLVVAVLRELGAKPLLMTVPLPGFYDDHTTFSAPVRSDYYDRWERAAEESGFPWLDFRADDEDPYFVTDTGAHLSPRGWIFADRAFDMFWHDRSLDDIRDALRGLAERAPAPSSVLTARADGPREEGPR